MAEAGRQNNFDLLRIFAASQVVVVHSIAHLGLPVDTDVMRLINAFPGVPIFFVISGFLISSAYERSATLPAYARNRALRIYPALWCCVSLTALVAILFGYSFWRPQAAAWFATQGLGLIYTPQFLRDFGFGSYNGSLWTIPIELQFYVALPLVYRLRGHGKQALAPSLRGMIALWLLFTAIAWASSNYIAALSENESEPLPTKLYRYSFIPHFYLFLTGVLLQKCGAATSPWMRGRGLWWLLGYLAFYFLLPSSVAKDLAGMLLLGLTAVAFAHTAPAAAQRLLHGNDISYGVYIYHGLLLNVFVELGWVHRWSLFAALAAGTYVLGLASWLMVERHFLRRKRYGASPATLSVVATKQPTGQHS